MLERARDKNPLPEGTVSVGAGLVIAGASAYGFTAIAQRAVGPGPYTAINQLWFLTWLVIPGLLLPLEQEIGRALSHRRAIGEGGLPVAQRAAALGGGLLSLALVVTLVLSPLLVRELFQGSWLLLLGLLFALVGYAGAHFARGVLAGTGLFRRYGLLFATDGIIRVAAAATCWLAGVETIGVYGFIVGVPPFAAVWIAVRGRRHLLEPGPLASWNELAPNLGWLLLGSVCAATIIQSPPLAANLLDRTDSRETIALIGAFGNGVLVARIPLFLFQAVQAALLPKLARLAGAGRYDEFKKGFFQLLAGVALIGVVGTAGAAVLGPWVVDTVYPSDVELPRRTMALLAMAFATYMIALALAQALIALHCHSRVAIGWLLGVVTFLVVALVGSDDVLLRVEIALAAAASLSLVFFAVTLRQAMRAGRRPDPDELVTLDSIIEP